MSFAPWDESAHRRDVKESPWRDDSATDLKAIAFAHDVEVGHSNPTAQKPRQETASSDEVHPERNHRASLFLQRQGKSMSWENINMTVKAKSKKQQDKQVLTNVWGSVPQRSISAIMGPSGSGKTSLLKVLAGRARSGGRIEIGGVIRLDGQIVDPTDIRVRRQIAYIEQENSLPATSTPREAIRFSARLRLSRDISNEDIEKFVDEILNELGLVECANTLLGGGLIKGVSGGELKRTSVGVELVVRPSMIVFDEPTSALDSYSAEQLVHVLKRVADAGSSVLFTIHQPPSAVFCQFDHLILLKKGRVMYNGDALHASAYFSSHGYPAPVHYSAADWVLNVAQCIPEETLEKAGFYPTNTQRLYQEIDAETGGHRDDDRKVISTNHHVHVLTEVVLLFKRELQKISRDKASLMVRFSISIFFNLLFGLIFFQIGKSDSSKPLNLNGHFGAIANLLIATMMSVSQASLLSFPSERPIFLREYSTNHYRVGTYFFSRLSVEATVTLIQIFVQTLVSYFLIGLQMGFFLFTVISYVVAMASVSVGVLIGSYVEDPKIASEMMPMLIVPQCLFAGFFISTDLIPVWLRWAQYLCSLTYAVRIALLAEFGDCVAQSCQALLAANNVEEIPSYWYWLILVALFVGFRFSAMLVLKRRATFH